MTKHAPTLREAIPGILADNIKSLPIVQANAKNSEIDQTGVSSAALKGTIRIIGICKFVLSNDIASFRENLSDSASLMLKLFNRSAQGDPISDCWLAMQAYHDLFDALAASDFDVALKLASVMGGRPELEHDQNHPFVLVFGYALKAFVLNQADEMNIRLQEFDTYCRTNKRFADFLGYATAFRGILSSDVELAQQGIEQIVPGHVKQSRHGLFQDDLDRLLCVWGVGMANLCRWRSLPVKGVPPLIPNELLYEKA